MNEFRIIKLTSQNIPEKTLPAFDIDILFQKFFFRVNPCPKGRLCLIDLQELCRMKPAKINKDWHLAHTMPKNPSLQQRIEWHLEHAKYCGCRQIPAKLKEEMKKLNIEIPRL
jgi:hypothetical protein